MTNGTATDLSHARQVETMAGYGFTSKAIAIALDTDTAFLERTYRRELAQGAIKANARVVESLYRKATGDDPKSVTAAIFWLKARAGWQETQPQPSGDGYRLANILSQLADEGLIPPGIDGTATETDDDRD
ncbi:MAG: hypothetical protein RLO50_15040 [Azospirillaceae bacterium]